MSFLPSKARRKAGLLFLGLPIASPPIYRLEAPSALLSVPGSNSKASTQLGAGAIQCAHFRGTGSTNVPCLEINAKELSSGSERGRAGARPPSQNYWIFAMTGGRKSVVTVSPVAGIVRFPLTSIGAVKTTMVGTVVAEKT
jgi:hypothetical protein